MFDELSGLRVVYRIRGTSTPLYGWSLPFSQTILASSGSEGRTFVSPDE